MSDERWGKRYKDELVRNKQKKEHQLGMPWTTATNRLNRIIMLSLAQQCGKNICFRCEEQITSVDDFTVDHKKSWLDVSPELFWSLENIAFSHSTCNKKAGRKPSAWGTNRRPAPRRKKFVLSGTIAAAQAGEESPGTIE
jgi:5-methylcytosine-specific restriction endonuclease McrA